MINANIKNLFDNNVNDEEIKHNKNDIYIYILISLIVVVLQFNSLITQYILLLLVFFIFSVRTGILFTTILFFGYNFNVFITHPILKYVIIFNIVISIIMIVIDACINTNQYLFVSLVMINIATILSNIYCIYIIYKDANNVDKVEKPEEKNSIGGINIKNINFNYRK